MSEFAFVREITAGTVGIWGLLITVVITLIKTWPILQQRATEAKEQQATQDGSLRADLMARIRELEASLTAEQRHCEERIRDMEATYNTRLKEIEDKYNGLVRMIAQASINKVVMLGDDIPDEIKDAAARAGEALQ